MSLRGAAPGTTDLLTFAGERMFDGFGLAAVFVLLSSLVAGAADVALWGRIITEAGIKAD